MNKKVKKLLAGYIVGVVLITGVLTGCGTKSGANVGSSTEKKTIAMVPKLIEVPYFDVCAEGAKTAGQELGIDVIYSGPKSADSSEQVRIIEELISKKVDAISVAPNDPSALAPTLKKAKAAGIQVLTFDSDSDEDARDIFVNQVSAEVLGRHLMDNIAKEIDGKGEFAILTSSFTSSNQNTWMKWMKSQLDDKYPDIKLVTIAPCGEDQQKAISQTQSLIKEYPNLKAIAALSTVAEPSAAQAIEQSGAVGKIKLVGLGTPSGMKEFLKRGLVQNTTLWDPKKLGYLTVSVAKSLLDKKILTDDQDFKNVGKIKFLPDNKEVIMGEPLDFTKDNVDQYDF